MRRIVRSSGNDELIQRPGLFADVAKRQVTRHRTMTFEEERMQTTARTREALGQIVARASTIEERLAGSFPADGEDPGQVDARLVRWCHNAAKGDWALF